MQERKPHIPVNPDYGCASYDLQGHGDWVLVTEKRGLQAQKSTNGIIQLEATVAAAWRPLSNGSEVCGVLV